MKRVAWSVMISVLSIAVVSATHAQAGDKTTACENLAKYMLAARKIMLESKGSDRDKLLAALQESYAEKIQAAPSNAHQAAEQWIRAFRASADKVEAGKVRDNTVIDLLRLRNRALDACGMNPTEAGF